MTTKAKAKQNQAKNNAKRDELLAIAQGLAIEGADVMSVKALKRAIKEAQETAAPEGWDKVEGGTEGTSEELPAASEAPTVAPAAEAPTLKDTTKTKRQPVQPLDSAAVAARLAKAAQVIGQVEGAPAAGGPWVSPHGRDHIVLGSFNGPDGYVYVRTLRPRDGREFTVRTKRIVRDIAKTAGVAGASVAPAQ